MSRRPLSSEIALTCVFLIIIFGVPIAQTCIQLSHGERAQFTDLFRYKPTEKNLRQFDETLKEDSWFEQKLRPLDAANSVQALVRTRAQRPSWAGADGFFTAPTFDTWLSRTGLTRVATKGAG